jgi:hypothetical protein
MRACRATRGVAFADDNALVKLRQQQKTQPRFVTAFLALYSGFRILAG